MPYLTRFLSVIWILAKYVGIWLAVLVAGSYLLTLFDNPLLDPAAFFFGWLVAAPAVTLIVASVGNRRSREAARLTTPHPYGDFGADSFNIDQQAGGLHNPLQLPDHPSRYGGLSLMGTPQSSNDHT